MWKLGSSGLIRHGISGIPDYFVGNKQDPAYSGISRNAAYSVPNSPELSGVSGTFVFRATTTTTSVKSNQSESNQHTQMKRIPPCTPSLRAHIFHDEMDFSRIERFQNGEWRATRFLKHTMTFIPPGSRESFFFPGALRSRECVACGFARFAFSHTTKAHTPATTTTIIRNLSTMDDILDSITNAGPVVGALAAFGSLFVLKYTFNVSVDMSQYCTRRCCPKRVSTVASRVYPPRVGMKQKTKEELCVARGRLVWRSGRAVL